MTSTTNHRLGSGSGTGKHHQYGSSTRLASGARPSSIRSILGIALGCALCFSVTTFGQTSVPADPAVVAGVVQAFYDQTQTLQAHFHQTYVHRLYKRAERSKGRVAFKKPGKMRWDYAQPNGKIVVSDGSKLLVYEPGDQGERGQVYEQSLGEAQLPQALSFLLGQGLLTQDFHLRSLDSRRQGYPSGHVLELRAKQPSPHYERILFYVEQDARLRGLVRRVLIVDHDGNRNRLDFSKMSFNRRVPDARFAWTPPKGTRKITP
ncbi:MAG: outer membrane lipoprotein carrier protein LolA [Proteobacteria bacterium]|nr:outer membrane lipoprotein carrier protein LolA [Pseudomonadota bacterium]